MSPNEKVKESDSYGTDGSFTHRDLIRKNTAISVEVDSHINRFGESHPHPTLGNTGRGAQLGEAFENDGSLEWSHDPRSESFNEKIDSADERREDEFIASQIGESFKKHPDLDTSKVTLKVENGLIFLSGEVNSQRDLEIIKKITLEIYGVTGVMNTINVHQDSHLESRGLLKGLH
jgi:hypothetical protein